MSQRTKTVNQRNKTMSKLLSALAAGGLLTAAVVGVLVLGTTAPPVKAWATLPPCDFLTGGGWIVYLGNKGTFGVGGGCKNGSGTNGIPYWGHLEYHDHGIGLNVHGTSITDYIIFPDDGTNGTDPKTGQPIGTRYICGTARTNLPSPNDNVNFIVRARDAGEPGVNDQFDIRVKNQFGATVYDTTTECEFHYLGSYVPCAAGNGGGGNIQLHKPNPSTTGVFNGGSCPAA